MQQIKRTKTKGRPLLFLLDVKKEFYKFKTKNQTIDFHEVLLKRRVVLRGYMAAVRRKGLQLAMNKAIPHTFVMLWKGYKAPSNL